MTKMHMETHIDLYVKCPVFRCSFNQHLNALADFSKTTQYHISWKLILGLLSCYMWTDRWTDMAKRISEFFCNFWFPEVPKMLHESHFYLARKSGVLILLHTVVFNLIYPFLYTNKYFITCFVCCLLNIFAVTNRKFIFLFIVNFLWGII
jgi:hypothetical protein